MEEICNNIHRTYNTTILNDISAFQQAVFLNESIKNKSTDFGRNVLMNLIYNHYRKEKPSPYLVGGPFTLSMHYSKEYKKTIYIFGEYHSSTTDCESYEDKKSKLEIEKLKKNCKKGEIKNPETDRCINLGTKLSDKIIQKVQKSSIMNIEEFLAELILNTDVFLDLYFEFPMYKKQDYQTNVWGIKTTKLEDNTSFDRLEALLYNFYKCVVYSKRSIDKCKLGRVHYMDIRKGDLSEEEMNDISWFRYSFKKITLSNITEFLQNPRTIKILNIFRTVNKKIFIKYWQDQILDNKYTKKELNKSYMGDKILDFITKKIVNLGMETRNNLYKYSTIISTIPITEKNLHYTYLRKINSRLVKLNSLVTDAYTLARIFKKFDIKKKSSLYSTFDQPEEPHNIIIYAGDSHSNTYRNFLNYLNFEEIASIKPGKTRNCINLENFPQPFFSHCYSKNISKTPQLKGLKWYGNSCYLDSSLIALFAQPTIFTNNILNLKLEDYPESKTFICGNTYQENIKNRKKVQEQLRIVVNSIRGVENNIEYCFNLRETFKLCPDIENYHDTEMKDAGEFIGYLLSLFPVNTAITKTVTYATNSLETPPKQNDLVQTSVIYDNKASVMFTIDPFQLYANNEMKISKYLENKEDSILSKSDMFYPYGKNNKGYIRRLYTRTLEKSPYIILNFKRMNPIDNSLILSKVIPEEYIKLPNGQKFTLSSIILFENYHYTSVFKVNKMWYYYNDMGGKDTVYQIKKIGVNLSEMLLKTKPDPQTNGTIYIYIPV